MRSRLHGAALLVVTGACVAICLGSGADGPRAGAGLLLTLVLPGAGLREVAGLRRELIENLMWAVGLSLATGAVLAVGLDVVGVALTRTSWTIALGVLAGVTALAQILVPFVPEREPGPRPTVRARISRWFTGAAGVAVGVVGAAAVAGAVVFAHHSAASLRDGEHFTELWLQPTPSQQGSLTLGVGNQEGRPERYQLTLRTASTQRRLTVTLAPGQRWQRQVSDVGPTARASLELRRGDRPGPVYRRVWLKPPGTPPAPAPAIAPALRAALARLTGIPEDGYVLGSPRAPVTLTVYASLTGDNRAFLRAELPRLLDRFVRPGRLRILFRTVTGIDAVRRPGPSLAVARIAQSVGQQDRFWEFLLAYDRLDHRQAGAGRIAAALAATPSIRAAQVRAGAGSPRIIAAIQRANDLARSSKVTALPTFTVTRGDEPGPAVQGDVVAAVARALP